MTLITWDAKYSIGDDTIDAQHQGIIKMINDLAELVKTGASDTEIRAMVDSLRSYSFDHLRYEEEMLKERKYDKFDFIAHVLLHNNYREQAINFSIDLLQGVIQPHEMLEFLNGWWYNHILVEDMKYARALKMV